VSHLPEDLTDAEQLQRKYLDLEDPFKNPFIEYRREDQYLGNPKSLNDDEVNKTAQSIKPQDANKSVNKSMNSKNPDQSDSVDKKSGSKDLASGNSVGLEPFVYLKTADECIKMEEDVEAGGAWLYFYKYTTLPDEELQKQKKKAKGTGANDYNTLVCRGWVDLREIQEPGTLGCELRVKLEQVLEGDPNVDANPCSFEDCYVRVKIATEVAIMPVVGDLNPRVSRITPELVNLPPKISSTVDSMEKLKTDIKISLKSLAEEYQKQFSTNPELTYSQELKKMNIFTKEQKTSMRSSRKFQFLKKFMESDRYDNLRNKMEAAIMCLVHDKFEKELSLFQNQVSYSDELLSEINIFIGHELENTIGELIRDNSEIHKDLTDSQKYYEEQRDTFKNEYFNFTPVDKLVMIASEYESLNLKYLADKKFKDVLLMQPGQSVIWHQFCLFNLRMLNFVRAEEALTNALEYEPGNLEY
jgi:metal-responsive CopG/Arc/MetJ family transcriptional regulator